MKNWKQRIKRNLYRFLYNILKPKYQTLEQFLAEELRKEIQALLYKTALEKQIALHKRRERGVSVWPEPPMDFNPDTCKHLKGGGKRGPLIDYNIGQHIFADGHIETKCLTCQKEFDLEDPQTKYMLEHSTNSASASERVVQIDKNGNPIRQWFERKDYLPIVVFQDNLFVKKVRKAKALQIGAIRKIKKMLDMTQEKE